MEDLELPSGSLYGDRFEIERTAGSGGMGTVYRARDRSSGLIVALKLLKLQSGQHSEETERFSREAQLLAELSHPGIVSYVAHGQTPDGRRYLAMEWLDGEDLGQCLTRGPLPIRSCVTLFTRIAEALTVPHHRGIVHRDLKPNNLFLVGSDAAQAKILDFGIARPMATAHAMTRTGVVIGTPMYMAPEQARGRRELSAAADIFSLGCVLYECLTGVPPFVADHVAAVLARILFDEPPGLETRRLGVPAELVKLVERMLCKEAAARLPDAAALRTELLGLGEFAEPELAATMGSGALPGWSSRPRSGPGLFAESEQSLFSIVLAAPASASADTEQGQEPMLQQSSARLEETDRQHLLKALKELGTSPDFLINGTLLVTVPSLVSAHDQATRAARAALLIKERWPDAVVSLATGPGSIKGRTAVGAVVEQAARILRIPPGGNHPAARPARTGVILDALSAKLLEGRFSQSPQPEGALLLAEEKEVDASRPLLGKPTPCVGRDAELTTLEAQLSGCIDESEARAVIITAPPGAGKSRLRHEFLRRVEKRSGPITILLGRGDAMSAGAAYGIVAKGLRGLCGISGGEPQAEQRQRMQERIELHLPAAERGRVLPFLGELCGVPFPEEDYPLLKEARQTPKMLPDQLRRACLTWLEAECQAAPVLFVLDDLHWGDELTVALIDEALRTLHSAPLLVFALARPEVHDTFFSLWKSHNPQKLVLKGLGKRACERLIQQALGKDVSAESVEWMVGQSAGNALFLEELIRAAAEGQIDKRPDTVIAMLQARIGHLVARVRRTVLAASVFGQTAWQGGVARVLGLPEEAEEVEADLQALVEAEMLEPHRSSRIPEQREYGFRHALVRDAAYALLTEEDLRLGHKLAAEFLEAHAKGRIASAVLAYHFRQAGLHDKALDHYLRAGDETARLFLFSEARLHYAAAEEMLRLLPVTPTVQRLHVDVLTRQLRSSLISAPPDVNFQRMKQGREILESLARDGAGEDADRLRVARIDYWCGRLHIYAGQVGQAFPFFHRVLPVAREFGDQELITVPSVFLSLGLVLYGQVSRAVALLEPAVAPMERLFGRDVEALRAYLYLGLGLASCGRYTRAMHYIEYLRPWVEEIGQAVYTGIFYMNLSSIYRCAGDWPATLAATEQTLSLGAAMKEPALHYLSWDINAHAQSHLGNHAAAAESRRRALELRQPFGGGLSKDAFEAIHAECLFNAGQLTAAAELAEAVAQAAGPAGSMFALTIAKRALGAARARLGAPADEVDRCLRESIDAANSTGNVMEALRAELVWGRACKERGDRAEMAAHFQQVRERLTDEMAPYARTAMLGFIEEVTAAAGGNPAPPQ